MEEETLVMIKPDGVKRRLIGECIRRFETAGFEIVSLEISKLSLSQASKLRSKIKKERPTIYSAVIDYTLSGPVCIIILKGDNAISRVRNMIGPANPIKAQKGTIRGDFAEGDMEELSSQGKAVQNVIHSSATLQEVIREKIILNQVKGGEKIWKNKE
ncbi:MAG: nucleoside-diphosphate kinase [Nanoarchaeota archaeon]